MGSSSSKLNKETVVHNETAIRFSQAIVDRLDDQLASPEVTPERQSNLDAQVRARLKAEVARLRQEEETVLREIGDALEKESLERERAIEGGGSSTLLEADMEELQVKLAHFHARKHLANRFPDIKDTQDALIQCYRDNSSRPLDCWKQVADFKDAVRKVEKEFIDSLKQKYS